MDQNGYWAVSLFSAGTRRFQTKGNRLAPLHLAVHDERALADVQPPDGADIKRGLGEQKGLGVFVRLTKTEG